MNTHFLSNYKQIVFSVTLLLLFSSCERAVDGLEAPKNSTNPEVFINGFSPGLNYAAFGGSVPTAFQVDNEVTYGNSTASMRFEIPDINDPRGAYAGGIFFTDTGRDLSSYDALTFWVKATKAASIDLVGFGNDFGENRFETSISGLRVNTNWQKVIIPIPDPSKLTNERGMFMIAEGPEDNRGYTFWIDNLKFERLGTIAHGKFEILNGQNQVETSFQGVSRTIGGLSSIFNMPNGLNQTVNVTPSYFNFSSSNPSIATVNARGVVSIVGGPGNAVITASLENSAASGSLTVESQGQYNGAPTPIHDPANVISLFSDAYDDVPVNYYNGFWAPFQTTQSADFTVGDDNVLYYTNFNFVGIEFSSPTIDARSMTHLRMDVYFPNGFTGGEIFRIELVDFGPDGAFGGGDNSSHRLTYTSPIIGGQRWVSFDIPLASFTGLQSRANLAQIIFEGTNIPGFYLDNVYFRN